MSVIRRYALPRKEAFTLRMPVGASLLGVVYVGDKAPQLWVECDALAANVERFFSLVPAGKHTPEHAVFIGLLVNTALFETPLPEKL